MMTMVRVDNIC